MPRFLFIAQYAPQGAQAVLAAGGAARRAAIEKMAAGMGGRLETYDFAFGEDDVYAIIELPDARAAAAAALTVNASGTARVRTVVLMTPEDVDATAQVEAVYRPPGT